MYKEEEFAKEIHSLRIQLQSNYLIQRAIEAHDYITSWLADPNTAPVYPKDVAELEQEVDDLKWFIEWGSKIDADL